MRDLDLIREHAALTTQATKKMAEAGAQRIEQERLIFLENSWGEPDPEFLAAAAYEAMVFSVIERGLKTEGVNADD